MKPLTNNEALAVARPVEVELCLSKSEQLNLLRRHTISKAAASERESHVRQWHPASRLGQRMV
jgi:hypothetical protein